MGPAAIRKANQFQVSKPAELAADDRKAIWDIFKDNMHGLYIKSAFGWDPAAKQEELFDPLSRFILCRKSTDSELGPLVAYAMFRFDREEGEDVAYCYELQVADGSRKCGLGNALMQKLGSIGSRWGMRKIMLTVLKENTAATLFYKSIGSNFARIPV
ncbi:hypothetical protein HWV62_23615 [Athelia sp. TMB]|nr:hypothetical protein HWV62_23615 [Athelia sp. TMB]